MTNGHARPSEIQKALATPHRSLMRWCSQLEEHGQVGFISQKPFAARRCLPPKHLPNAHEINFQS
jgi:hypothetical protein